MMNCLNCAEPDDDCVCTGYPANLAPSWLTDIMKAAFKSGWKVVNWSDGRAAPRSYPDWGTDSSKRWIKIPIHQTRDFPTISAQWKADGLCPKCGDRGEWRSLALVCKNGHGVFAG